jgi:phage tail tube protein FII
MDHVRNAGNLYCEGFNSWESLASYQLPSPRAKTENFHPGGGIMELEVPIGAIEPLTFAFNLVSANPRMLGGFGLELRQSRLYTVYELLTDHLTGVKRERIITMRGVFSEATPDEMQGRGLRGYGYQIKSITDYEDVIEGYGIIARFTFRTNTWSGYGFDIGGDDNRILRIAG